MSRVCVVAVLTSVLSFSSSAATSVKPVARLAVDRTANRLIEKYNVKAKQLGSAEESADPALWAIYITALCEQRQDYKETNGPFVSDPVAVLAGKVKDDGSVEGAKDEGLTAFLAAHALESTENGAYKAKVEALKKKAKAPAAAEFKTLEQLASVEFKPETLLATVAACRALAKEGKKEVTIDGKPVNWPETIAGGILKREQPNGTYTGDLRTDALILQILNVCYKQL